MFTLFFVISCTSAKPQSSQSSKYLEEETLASTGNFSPGGFALKGKPVVGFWEWGESGQSGDSSEEKLKYRNRLLTENVNYFEKLKKHGINQVYFCVTGTNNEFALAIENLPLFIKKADTNSIKVYALFGGSELAKTENHDKADKIIEAILNYNKDNPGASFAGIQTDVEPYGDNIVLDQLAPQYIEGLRRQKVLIDNYNKSTGDNLQFEATVPFWYAIPKEMHDENKAPIVIDANGIKGTIIEHVIHLTDSTAVMAYRDNDIGDNGVSGIARWNLRILNKYNEGNNANKKMLLSLETQAPTAEFGVNSNLTLYEEGKNKLVQLIDKLGNKYVKEKYINGVAYHHGNAFLEMNPGIETDTNCIDKGILITPNIRTSVNFILFGEEHILSSKHTKDGYEIAIQFDAKSKKWGRGIKLDLSEKTVDWNGNTIEITYKSNHIDKNNNGVKVELEDQRDSLIYEIILPETDYKWKTIKRKNLDRIIPKIKSINLIFVKLGLEDRQVSQAVIQKFEVK